jgi:oxepin-CoA hydrolase/3-oxo-5,6-dehydrosuberyl-CoA semialdehyde dehydrogenase
MLKLRFDVNDDSLRDTFLRTFFFGVLDGLRPETPAAWGAMTAQEMVEHLLWAFEISTGRVAAECATPEGQLERMKTFLHHNRPTPRDFMNPALAEGLPAVRHRSLGEAVAALREEVDAFLRHLRDDHTAVHVHPIFGPIGLDDWSRTHFKHAAHHLQQFGLLQLEP